VRRKVEEVEREMVKRGVSEGEEGAAVSTVDMGEMMMPGKRAVL
jgi:hypothetical protein